MLKKEGYPIDLSIVITSTVVMIMKILSKHV